MTKTATTSAGHSSQHSQAARATQNAPKTIGVTPGFFRTVMAIVRRHIMVWWENVYPALASNIASPMLYLFALGFGLGAVVKSVGDIPYLVFVLPGVVANASFFAASFEAALNSYSRMTREGVYMGILSTPARLIEILVADALFGAGKGLLSGASVLLVGFMVGGVQMPAIAMLAVVLPALFVIFIGCFCFACMALFLMSFAKTNEFFSYFFTFWVTPSFLFTGVFFEVNRFPDWVGSLALALPMTHFIHILRPLMIPDMPLTLLAAAGHLGYIIAVAGLCLFFAHRRLQKRLLDK